MNDTLAQTTCACALCNTLYVSSYLLHMKSTEYRHVKVFDDRRSFQCAKEFLCFVLYSFEKKRLQRRLLCMEIENAFMVTHFFIFCKTVFIYLLKRNQFIFINTEPRRRIVKNCSKMLCMNVEYNRSYQYCFNRLHIISKLLLIHYAATPYKNQVTREKNREKEGTPSPLPVFNQIA